MKLKSANQRYKESGSSLPFKEWIEREKAKGVVIPQIGVTDVVEETLKNNVNETTLEPNKVLGLNKKILIISGLIIVGAIAYNYYRKNK